MAELLVRDESRLTVAAAPTNDSALSSLAMVCNGSRLFSPAPCTGENNLQFT